MSQTVWPSSQPSGGSSRVDRRETVRQRYRQAASCFILPSYERFWAWAQDISVAGIGIIGNRRLEPGTLVVIQLKNAALPLLTLSARVAHCTAYPNNNWWVGCEFHHRLPQETLDALVGGNRSEPPL